MEWTLSHDHPDDRGNRRYFTLASSPTENTIRLGVKFYKNGSTYKNALLKMEGATKIVAAQLAGDFVLPKDAKKKLVFVAGGVGITPFRSMLKYLTDKNEPRDIIMFYSNRKADEIVYKDVIEDAQRKLGIKTIYTLTDHNHEQNWKGQEGRINAAMIMKHVIDYKDRLFYISGPQTMVASTEVELKSIGVKDSHIIKDFFPGLV